MSKPHDRMIENETEEGAEVRRLVVRELTQTQRNDYKYVWDYAGRPEQLPPPGDWRIWMIMAGRGFGKTRSGAEWVRSIADANPNARIALVSSSLAEARAVMVEGESGLLAICRPEHRPVFEPSLHRVRFESGAQAQLFSAAEPETLRGPQHSHARGPGAEGVLHQCCAEPARRTAGARCTRVPGYAASQPVGGPLLSSDEPGWRGLGRPGGLRRRVRRRSVALCRPSAGDEGFRLSGRSPPGAPIRLEARHVSCVTHGGITTDVEPRAVINALIQSLHTFGILATARS